MQTKYYHITVKNNYLICYTINEQKKLNTETINKYII